VCRLFVRRHCGRCRQPIVYNELVVQTNDLVYHSDCFSCVLCNHHFTPGQQFAVADDGNVYCPSDFQLRQHSSGSAHDAVSTREVPVTAADGRDSTTAHVPLCRSPLPNGADTVGSIWSDVPWQQLETSIRSSTYTFTPVTGNHNQSINEHNQQSIYCPRNACIRILSACDTFPTVTAAKCSLLTNTSKITSSSARLIDALLFSWYAVFVVLTKTLQSIMQE